jgi:hypothetical protein
MLKCRVLLKPVLGDMNGNLQFAVPNITNWLNKTEPATVNVYQEGKIKYNFYTVSKSITNFSVTTVSSKLIIMVLNTYLQDWIPTTF